MADTPMMKQYLKLKEETPGCILFFRLGDFYEMFNDDAVLVSKELNLTLTTRDRDKDIGERTPMCGVPYHSAETYIARLLKKGYKVAICEQTEDPSLAKGLVSRDIVRIITPGTVMDSSMLDESRPNYICSVYLDEGRGSVCFTDISTGETILACFEGNDCADHVLNELVRYCPSEAILNTESAKNYSIWQLLTKRINCLSQSADELFEYDKAYRLFQKHFGEALASEHSGRVHIICAAGALMSYLYSTQKNELSHINTITFYSTGHYMELDYQTRRNLELTETLRLQEKRGSLLWVLDRVKTAMGGRLLRSWLEKPLLSPALIKRRLNGVNELVLESLKRGEILHILHGIDDMERLIGRIVYGNCSCRDLAGLSSSTSVLPEIKQLLQGFKSGLLDELSNLDELSDMRKMINDAICDSPPFSVREGGMIRAGYNAEVDRLRGLTENAKGAVASVEAQERERTGLKKLKVGYNKVFGYYIELPRSHSDIIPDNYTRKQTLVSSERFITQELKELESELLTARDHLCELEYNLFMDIRGKIAGLADRIKRTAYDIARLDVLCCLAETAVRNNYCMPEVDISENIDIREGRHPVVEKSVNESMFVPNDVSLNSDSRRISIITGPNMAGKSTYMRQTALIVLMAQIGSFVPAKSAHIGITDRIFTRIGAADDLSSGQSTFMVEMTEVAAILKNATRSSLLILDEIGRGTSTYDGMAIARAVLEYCADKRVLGAKTMFATHYHELTKLAHSIPGVINLNTAVKTRGDEVIFLRRIVEGGADRSYGVEVAKLAGVPDSVIKRAKTILAALESGTHTIGAVQDEPEEDQFHIEDLALAQVTEKLKETDLYTLTPIEAMNLLFELKKELTQ